MDNDGWIPVNRGRRPKDVQPQAQTNDRHRPSTAELHPSPENELVTIFYCQTEKKLASINKLTVANEVRKLIGIIESMKFINGGNLLLKFTNIEQRAKALKLTSICGVPIRPELPKYLTDNRGVIFGVPNDVSTDTIKSEIETFSTIDGLTSPLHTVERLFNRKTEQYSSTVIIDFGKNIMPEYVSIFFQKYKTSNYVRQPLRCFKCQKFGHGIDTCKAAHTICPHCSIKGHTYQTCTNKSLKPQCINCKGGHSAGYRQCPKYIEAREVEKLRSKLKCTFKEAMHHKKYETSEINKTSTQKNTVSNQDFELAPLPTTNAWANRANEATAQSENENTTTKAHTDKNNENNSATQINHQEKEQPETNHNISQNSTMVTNIASIIGFVMCEYIKGKLKTTEDVVGCITLGTKSIFNQNISGSTILESIENIKKHFIQQTNIPSDTEANNDSLSMDNTVHNTIHNDKAEQPRAEHNIQNNKTAESINKNIVQNIHNNPKPLANKQTDTTKMSPVTKPNKVADVAESLKRSRNDSGDEEHIEIEGTPNKKKQHTYTRAASKNRANNKNK